jgi:hypothetical protein
MAFEDTLGLFTQPLFSYIILPFLLIFTVVFAILEKTAILGKDKRQINAIVAFVFGLVSIGVPAAMGIISKVIPIIAVIIVIFLAFMLVFGFIGGTTEQGGLPQGLKTAFGIILGIAMIATIAWATGALDFIKAQNWAGTAMTTGIVVIFIIAVIAIVVTAAPAQQGQK